MKLLSLLIFNIILTRIINIQSENIPKITLPPLKILIKKNEIR